MKELPILFNGDMVRAIIEGRKTQTRRIVKPQPDFWFGTFTSHGHGYDNGKKMLPPCKPGDLLYVRETFRLLSDIDNPDSLWNPKIEYAADGGHEMIYECDGDGFQVFNKDGSEKFISWKPSIHMPKSAARIWLQVEDVRVERLQDISEEDSKAEGVREDDNPNGYPDFKECPKCGGAFVHGAFGAGYGVTEVDCTECDTDVKKFKWLWQSVYGGESWEANPWVWTIAYKVLSTTGKPNQ